MKFGTFYEMQLPRPWADDSEYDLYQQALDQVELSDRLGFDYVWEVEHHHLEEYSHSSAPEVFLAAASQRTTQIRLGHGVMLLPPAYNHPVRCAERIATLDLVSGGRVEFGTGESATMLEMGGFGIDPALKKRMWRETVEQIANMMVMDPYPGFEGEFFSSPCRNVLPKPRQKPHPPMWVACTNPNTIKWAARHGLGALTFAFTDAENMREWVADYYRILREECEPVSHVVNPNVAVVTPFSVHEDEDEAVRRGIDGFRFFQYALIRLAAGNPTRPGHTDLWSDYLESKKQMNQFDFFTRYGGIGTPDQVREHLQGYADAGVDQVIFIQQSGKNTHEHICESLELFAAKVMDHFKEGEAEREARKREELAPFVAEALARKQQMAPIDPADVPEVPSVLAHMSQQGQPAS